MSDRVSVAVVTYNGERHVAEQLTSVLAQSRPPDEVVVRDDGSTDDTVEVARRTVGSRGQVVAGDVNVGVLRNVAACLALTSGELVALCDQDDRWHPDKLATVERVFDDPSVMAVFSDARLVDDRGVPRDGTLWEAFGFDPEHAGGRRVAGLERLLQGNVVTGATLVVRRSVLEQALPLPDLFHDHWLALVAATTGVVVAVPEPLVDYRLHGANVEGLSGLTWRRRLSGARSTAGRSGTRAALLRLLLARTGDLSQPPAQAHLAEQLAFLERRAALPRARHRRLLPVVRLHRDGAYAKQSRPLLSVVVDLLVPGSVLRAPVELSKGW